MHLARCVPKLLQKYFGSLNYGPPCILVMSRRGNAIVLRNSAQYLRQKFKGSSLNAFKLLSIVQGTGRRIEHYHLHSEQGQLGLNRPLGLDR